MEGLADAPKRVALMWGPLVLAGDLGPRTGGRGRRGSPTTRPAMLSLAVGDRPIGDWLKPVSDKPGIYSAPVVGRELEVEFVPFYRLQRRTYSIYWDLTAP